MLVYKIIDVRYDKWTKFNKIWQYFKGGPKELKILSCL